MGHSYSTNRKHPSSFARNTLVTKTIHLPTEHQLRGEKFHIYPAVWTKNQRSPITCAKNTSFHVQPMHFLQFSLAKGNKIEARIPRKWPTTRLVKKWFAYVAPARKQYSSSEPLIRLARARTLRVGHDRDYENGSTLGAQVDFTVPAALLSFAPCVWTSIMASRHWGVLWGLCFLREIGCPKRGRVYCRVSIGFKVLSVVYNLSTLWKMLLYINEVSVIEQKWMLLKSKR